MREGVKEAKGCRGKRERQRGRDDLILPAMFGGLIEESVLTEVNQAKHLKAFDDTHHLVRR